LVVGGEDGALDEDGVGDHGLDPGGSVGLVAGEVFWPFGQRWWNQSLVGLLEHEDQQGAVDGQADDARGQRHHAAGDADRGDTDEQVAGPRPALAEVDRREQVHEAQINAAATATPWFSLEPVRTSETCAPADVSATAASSKHIAPRASEMTAAMVTCFGGFAW
jgi:hypothetical protein